MVQMNLSQNINRLTDVENRFLVAIGEGDRRGKDWKCGIGYKMLFIGWINNKVLLYSTRD